MLVALGCGGSSRAGANANARMGHKSAVELVATPSAALSACRTALLRPACPSRIPATGAKRLFAAVVGNGEAFDVMVGAEHLGNARLDQPPRFLHLVVLAGKARSLFHFAWPPRGPAVAVGDGLLARPRSAALLLANVRWAGRPGVLALAPPSRAGGALVANHLMFTWRRGAQFYAVTLHAWEPFAQAVATLRAVVDSLPAVH